MTSVGLLAKYLLIMELRFDVMLCCNLGNENSDVGHIKCSSRLHLFRRPQVPHPCSRKYVRAQHRLMEIFCWTFLCLKQFKNCTHIRSYVWPNLSRNPANCSWLNFTLWQVEIKVAFILYYKLVKKPNYASFNFGPTVMNAYFMFLRPDFSVIYASRFGINRMCF